MHLINYNKMVNLMPTLQLVCCPKKDLHKFVFARSFFRERTSCPDFISVSDSWSFTTVTITGLFCLGFFTQVFSVSSRTIEVLIKVKKTNTDFLKYCSRLPRPFTQTPDLTLWKGFNLP